MFKGKNFSKKSTLGLVSVVLMTVMVMWATSSIKEFVYPTATQKIETVSGHTGRFEEKELSKNKKIKSQKESDNKKSESVKKGKEKDVKKEDEKNSESSAKTEVENENKEEVTGTLNSIESNTEIITPGSSENIQVQLNATNNNVAEEQRRASQERAKQEQLAIQQAAEEERVRQEQAAIAQAEYEAELKRQEDEKIKQEQANKPKYSPNSLYINGANVGAGTAFNVSNGSLSGSLQLADSTGHNLITLTVGAIDKVNDKGFEVSSGIDMNSTIGGYNGIVLIVNNGDGTRSIAQVF